MIEQSLSQVPMFSHVSSVVVGFTIDALLGNSCVGQTIDDINVKADSPANIIDALWLLWNC